MVTDPTDGTNDALWSFVDTGRFPVVVRVAEPQPTPPGMVHVRLVAFDQATGLPGTDPVDAVRLAPGEQVGVLVSVGFGCATWSAGTGSSISGVDLRVTTLGLTRTVTARWPGSVGVETTRDVARRSRPARPSLRGRARRSPPGRR